MYSTELKINRSLTLLEVLKKDPSLEVGLNIERKCNKCKKSYIPCKNDISSKRPSTYYKTCFNCRTIMKDYLQLRKSNI